jgi:hypothetical protein
MDSCEVPAASPSYHPVSRRSALSCVRWRVVTCLFGESVAATLCVLLTLEHAVFLQDLHEVAVQRGRVERIAE